MFTCVCCDNLFKDNTFKCSKTLIEDKVLTDDIAAIRNYIMNKEHKRVLKWTNRTKPGWWTKE